MIIDEAAHKLRKFGKNRPKDTTCVALIYRNLVKIFSCWAHIPLHWWDEIWLLKILLNFQLAIYVFGWISHDIFTADFPAEPNFWSRQAVFQISCMWLQSLANLGRLLHAKFHSISATYCPYGAKNVKIATPSPPTDNI